MNYAKLNLNDIANGPGIRVSLFVSGCEHYCKNCFNQEAWDFNYGNKYDGEVLRKILMNMGKSYISGLSILGGEPMHPNNVSTVCDIITRIHFDYPNKSIWVYTGYTIEELILYYQRLYFASNINQIDQFTAEKMYATQKILEYADVLVDGKFVEELKDLKLRFKGSSNQRIIDLNYWRMSEEIKEPILPN